MMSSGFEGKEGCIKVEPKCCVCVGNPRNKVQADVYTFT